MGPTVDDERARVREWLPEFARMLGVQALEPK
jgi:hypothetical protein